jgi:2,4-diaminopentanoate dehydrogenase
MVALNAPHRPLRVAVWSTGGIGSISIAAIKRRPNLDLVGVWVHSPEKVGKDAGELANGEAIGLAATNDFDALLALDLDCVVYAASGPGRDAAAVPDYVRLLSAGVDVVTSSSTRLIYPPTFDRELLAQIEAACKAGGTSIYNSGIEPGFALDQLPLVLMTQSDTIRTIRCAEIGMYDDYRVEFIMRDAMGFGKPMDYTPFIAIPGVVVAEFSGGIRLMADALGVELEGVVESVERAPTPRRLEVACGTIDAGTAGAIRMKAAGIVGGREAIVIEHITRLARDVAPEWPIGEHKVTYRIEIEGTPNIHANVACTLDDPAKAGVPHMTSGGGAMVATAMRLINAIPYVVDARPGVLDALDLPLTVPRNGLAAG